MTMSAVGTPVGGHDDAAAAPLLRRGLAAVIDAVVLAFVVSGLLALLGQHALWERTGGGGFVVRVGAACVAALVYPALWMTATNGQTVGKRLLGLRVIRLDGLRITFVRAVWRESVLKIGLVDLPGLLGGPGSSARAISDALWAVDVLWSVPHPRNRMLHDLGAGTRVILEPGVGQ